MTSSNYFCLIIAFVEAAVFARLSSACPGSSGNFDYNPEFELLKIDTGNKTRTPLIEVTDSQENPLRSYPGCSDDHVFNHSGTRWSYQVARFKFESNINIGSHVQLKGVNTLLLIGKNISIDANGVLKVASNSTPPPYGEPRFVGGFVAKRSFNGVPCGGPGRGVLLNEEAGGAGHGGHGGGDNYLSYGNLYGLTNTDLYLGGSTGAFTGSQLPGIGGPAIQLEASGRIEIRGTIDANAIPGPTVNIASHEMIAGNSGGLVRLLAEKVNISQGARISVEGSKELCGNSSYCKAGGGSGGIVQIISRSGSIVPGAIILSGRSGDYRGAPEDGFLYIKGVKDGHFKTFPDKPFFWGYNPSSTRILPSSTWRTIKRSTFQSQFSIRPNQIRTATDTVTPTFIRIPTSRPYHGTTLNITASYAHEISRITSHGSSPAREVSSPSLHNPHVAMSSTKVPPTKKDNVENLQKLLDRVKLYKENKGNVSNQAAIITELMESFEVLTVVGNLTTEIINISVSMIEELNELMISEELSVNQSELQNQLSTLVTTVDELLDDRDATAWRKSGMVMKLVEALERTSSLALNYTSATNQSILLSRKNIEMLAIVEYFDPSSNLTVPDRKEHVRPTGLLTFQASGFSGRINESKGGRLVVSMVVYKNLTSHFTNNKKSSYDREASQQATVLNSEIISVIAFYDGRPLYSLGKEAFLIFGNKSQNGADPRCVYWESLPGEREWLSNGVSLITSDSKQTVCSTNHLTSFAVIISLTDVDVSPEDQFALDIITYIGCGISLVALASSIIIFLCLRSLTDIRYRIHLHLCIALAMAQVVFLTGIKATEKQWLCTLVAVLLHYLYTASFTWMSAEGLHLYFEIVTVFNLESIKMVYYVIFCWGSPVIVVGISAIARMEGYGARNMCWLSLDKGFIWSFVGPVLAIILFNLVMLGMTIKVLVSLTDVAECNAQHSVRSGVKAALVLMPLLGITWIFGLLSVNSSTIAFQYLFAIINSLQGLFIFVFHCIGNTEVRAALTRLKKRHSVKIASTQDVSLDKMKSRSKALKPSKDTDNQKNNTVKVVDPADLEFKPID